jgi:hypothetical protein
MCKVVAGRKESIEKHKLRLHGGREANKHER